MSDPLDLVRLSRTIADRAVAPVAGRLVDATVAAVDGDYCSLAKADPSAPPTPGFFVPPHLLIEAGDHVWAYDDGGFKLVLAVLNRRALNLPFSGCRLRRATAQSIADDTSTAVLFDTEDDDTLSMHDTSVNSDQMVVPPGYGGLWLVQATARFAANATGYRSITVTLDAEVAADVTEATTVPPPSAGVAARLQVMRLVRAEAHQVLRVMVRHTRGSALDLEAAAVAAWRTSTQ